MMSNPYVSINVIRLLDLIVAQQLPLLDVIFLPINHVTDAQFVARHKFITRRCQNRKCERSKFEPCNLFQLHRIASCRVFLVCCGLQKPTSSGALVLGFIISSQRTCSYQQYVLSHWSAPSGTRQSTVTLK